MKRTADGQIRYQTMATPYFTRSKTRDSWYGHDAVISSLKKKKEKMASVPLKDVSAPYSMDMDIYGEEDLRE